MKITAYGKKENKKIILIHGFESLTAIWEKYIEVLSDKYYLIVPTLPCHGGYDEHFYSFEQCAQELEDFCVEQECKDIYAIYGMSMGGVLASMLLERGRLMVEKMIIESSPLLPFGRLITSVLIKQYIDITHKSQKRDPKTLEEATKSIISKEYLEDFLNVLDHLSDEDIERYLRAVDEYKFPKGIDIGQTKIVYCHGTRLSEFTCRRVARYLKKHYPSTEIIEFKDKGHCEDALLHPEIRAFEIYRMLD